MMAIIAIVTSCGPSTSYDISYDSSFPKQNKDLTKILGNSLTIKHDSDTIRLLISSAKGFNLIVDSKTGDTLFFGKVCRYRGFYFFNIKNNDTNYSIYPVMIKDNLIYGLIDPYQQMNDFATEIFKRGEKQKMVRYFNEVVSSDKSLTLRKYRLHPDKKELKRIYAPIMDSIVPDTIINYQEISSVLTSSTSLISQMEPEDFEQISKVYPNPAKDAVNIELRNREILNFQMYNSEGMLIKQGRFSEIINKLDLTGIEAGVYSITLVKPVTNEKETVKIIKVQ